MLGKHGWASMEGTSYPAGDSRGGLGSWSDHSWLAVSCEDREGCLPGVGEGSLGGCRTNSRGVRKPDSPDLGGG
jgi:hypothetical protein